MIMHCHIVKPPKKPQAHIRTRRYSEESLVKYIEVRDMELKDHDKFGDEQIQLMPHRFSV